MKKKKPGPQKGTKHTDVERSAFGLRLFNARKARGITQQELADKIGITKRMIANYEGTSEGPTVERLTELAQALGVTVSYLLGESTQKKLDTDMSPVFRRHLEILQRLPTKEQKTVIDMVEGLELKKRAKEHV